MIRDKAEEVAETHADEKVSPEEWDLKGLDEAIFNQFNFHMPISDELLDGLTPEGLAEAIAASALELYDNKEKEIGEENFRQLERYIMLNTVDTLWKDHLLSMDHLKEGIGLRGYAQQNPLIVYKKEGFEMFQEMISRIQEQTISILFRIQPAEPERIEDTEYFGHKPKEQNLIFSSSDNEPPKKKPVRRTNEKTGRNDPCPCGSGKKFKKCCG
jgi:preprotein translocase subunit SecA